MIIYIYIYIYMYMYIYIYVYMYVYIYIYIYVYIYIEIYIHTCVYIYIYRNYWIYWNYIRDEIIGFIGFIERICLTGKREMTILRSTGIYYIYIYIYTHVYIHTIIQIYPAPRRAAGGIIITIMKHVYKYYY